MKLDFKLFDRLASLIENCTKWTVYRIKWRAQSKLSMEIARLNLPQLSLVFILVVA